MSSDRHLKPENRADKRSETIARSGVWKHVLVTFGAVVVLGALLAAGVVFSGLCNVAATVVDSPPLAWLLVTVREESIKRHARGIQAPPLDDAARRGGGFRIFRENCATCHTPVGRTPSQLAAGLNPQAPGFGKDSDEMTAAELFWVTKNGIRFTGMPAWGLSRSDEELWNVVAFLMTLPQMSAADYDAMDRRVSIARDDLRGHAIGKAKLRSATGTGASPASGCNTNAGGCGSADVSFARLLY